MSEELDINAQYEMIFGKKERPNIYSPDDEEYNSLRQEILVAKREFNSAKKMPFDGIKLLSYDEYKRDIVVREVEKKGNRVFYIRKYEASKLVVYAAAYFDVRNSQFIVLKESFFKGTNYFAELKNKLPVLKRLGFLQSFLLKNGLLVQQATKQYDSASLAASYFLGKKSMFREWKDDRGKTLDAYYVKYKSESIDDIEDKSFPDYVQYDKDVIDEHDKAQKTTARRPLYDVGTGENKSTTPALRLFYIKRSNEPGRQCNATGYYDAATNKFVMQSGSLLSLGTAPMYNLTTAGISRRSFVNKYCLEEYDGYRLGRDYVFDTPSTAASYALGRSANGWTEWREQDGTTLDSVYRK